MATGRSRREVLQLLAALGAGTALGAALSGCSTGSQAPVVDPPPAGPRYTGDRPNVVLVFVDDLAADVMGGSSRYPFLQTPNLTRLEQAGATFATAMVPTAVCSPSRASLLTGTYAHKHGVLVNDVQDLTGELPNFPALLQQAGYDTGYVGKWHMRNATAEPRLSFDYWLSFKGQGVYQNPTLNENGRTFKKRGYVTDILTEYAVDYIQTPRDKPFCLIVSHKAGHKPYKAAARHERAFAGAELPEPSNFGETFAGKPAWQRRYKLCGLGRAGWDACEDLDIPEGLPLEAWNPYDDEMLTHLRTLLAVDEGLGALVEALENTAQLDNTLFVFTSDNGYMLGAHRLADKRTMYEESLKVPLVMHYPERFGATGRLPQLVSTLDLAPTILEFAGVATPSTMQGASLVPLLTGTSGAWREQFFYEYFQERVPGPGVPTTLGIRTARWKYVHYPELPDDLDELYDLETDPHELRNLIADPASAGVLTELQALFQQQLADTGYQPQLASL